MDNVDNVRNVMMLEGGGCYYNPFDVRGPSSNWAIEGQRGRPKASNGPEQDHRRPWAPPLAFQPSYLGPGKLPEAICLR